jgi:type I restriction enzyme S subunit
MSNLPTGWTWATLEELLAVEDRAITDGPFGSKLASRHYTTSGARVIRLQNIGDCIFNDEHAYISLDYFEELRAHEACAGDLVIASLGDELPRACLIPELGEPAIVKADCIRARIHPEVDTKWVLYVLAAPQTRQYAASRIRGIGRPRLGLGEMRRLPVPLPPLTEQRRIVATLEEHLSRVDAGNEYLNQASKQESQLRIAIYTAAVEDRLITSPRAGAPIAEQFDEERQSRWRKKYGDRKYKLPIEPDLEIEPFVPDSWHVVSLEAATDPTRLIQYGILMPRVKTKGSVPYVEVKDLAGETLSGKNLHRTSQELDEKFSKSRLAKNDVVMAVRGSYERSAVVPGDLEGANVSRDVVRIAPLTDLDPDYLHIYLQSTFSRRYFAHHARGVAVKGVNTASVRSLPVVIPALEVQHEIVREASHFISVVNKISTEIAYARKRASSLRKSLLTEAFAGRLVPQDPNDEPAAVLLERIRAEEQAAHPRVRGGRRTAKQTPQEETLL